MAMRLYEGINTSDFIIMARSMIIAGHLPVFYETVKDANIQVQANLSRQM